MASHRATGRLRGRPRKDSGSRTCPRCAAVGIDHFDFKAKCEADLFTFVKYFVSDWVSEDLHHPVAEWIGEESAQKPKKLLVMFARGHLKTTLCTVGFPLWLTIRSRGDVRIALVMSSGELAEEKLGKIRWVAESDDFKHFWGDLVPEGTAQGTLWTQTALEFNRKTKYEEPTISAYGVKKRRVGGHYDVIVLDDLIDEQNSNSQLMIGAAKRYLSGIPGMWVSRKDALLLIVGTAWPGGFYEPLMDDESFKRCVFGCRVDDRYRRFMAARGHDTSHLDNGSPIFHERENEETLAEAKRGFGAMYANQMDNMFVDDKLRQFREEDIRYYSWGDDQQKSTMVDGVYYPVSTLYVQTTIDPGGSGKWSEDNSAVITTGWLRGTGVAFVLDVWCEKATTKAVIEETLRQAERWGSKCIRAEHVAMQSMLSDWIADEMTRRAKRFKLVPARAGVKSKGQRLMRLQPYVANHQIYVRHDHRALVDELCGVVIVGGNFMGDKSPNMADALAYHTEFWRAKPPAFDETEEIPFEEEEDEIVNNRQVRYRLRCPTRDVQRISV